MTNYSPFDNNLHDLTAADLSVLQEVSEGWYVEYKRELPNANSIAKSISALANTYGGWVFYGVAEKSKEEAVAGSLPGIARRDVDMALQRLRQAAGASVNPTPHYECQVVWGPNEALQLPADHAVICVQVPQGRNAPYVHRSGVIYRRVADGSEPKPEGDRFILDQLWRRTADFKSQYRDWIDTDPEFSKGEGEMPYVRIMLLTDPWDERKRGDSVPIEELRSIFSVTQGVVNALPFDTVYHAASGVVARQLRDNSPHSLSMTWRLHSMTRSDVIIPLNFFANGIGNLYTGLDGYEQRDRFIRTLSDAKYDDPRVVDLNYVFRVILGIVETQRRLNARIEWTRGYHAKIRVLNAWRTVPFLDVKAVVESFSTHGLPMCLDANSDSPPGDDLDGFREIKAQQTESEDANIVLEAIQLFSLVARSFGIPGWINDEPQTKEVTFLTSLLDAGTRAMQNQARRNAAQ